MSRDLFSAPPEIEGERPESAFRADVDLARKGTGEADAERDAFLASVAGMRLRSRLDLSVARRRRQRRLTALGALAAGIAAVGMGIFFALPRDDDGAPIRLKGSDTLLVYCKRGNEVIQVLDGAILHPGDKIRFVHRSSRPYLMVVNAEERGEVQPFYPFPAGDSVRIPTGVRAELPGSIELDESVGTERVVAVFSERPLSFAEVRAAVEHAYPRRDGRRRLEAHRPLRLPGEVISLRVEKRAGAPSGQ
jgi:hypothetical protein